jgi:hypothetical protein
LGLLGEREDGQEEWPIRIVAIDLEIGAMGWHQHDAADQVLSRTLQGFSTVHVYREPHRPHPLPPLTPVRQGVRETRQVVLTQCGRLKPIGNMGRGARGRR